jgi:hypothetical protein
MAVLALVLTSILVACAGGKGEPAPATLDGKALVEERCVQCHDLTTVEGAAKTREEWQATVERMVAKGAQLNEAEQAAAVNYLSDAYPK